jgi:hypothetical protein
MSAKAELDLILEKLDGLSWDELLTVQEKITSQLRLKIRPETTVTAPNQPESPPPNAAPETYQPTAIDEAEPDLSEIFTPEELAAMVEVDLSSLQPASKPPSEG